MGLLLSAWDVEVLPAWKIGASWKLKSREECFLMMQAVPVQGSSYCSWGNRVISLHEAYPRSCRVGLLIVLGLSSRRKLKIQGRKRRPFLCVWEFLMPCGHPHCTAVLLLWEVSWSILSGFDLFPKEWPVSCIRQISPFFLAVVLCFLWPTEIE